MRRMFSRSNIAAYLSLTILLLQIILIVLSWMLTAINPNMHIRSILGSDGLRWLFGSIADNVCSHILVWLLFAGMSIGVIAKSGLLHTVGHYKEATDYERMALFIVMWEFIGAAVIIVLLAFVPHAILLSALGTFFPSSFSASIVPFTTFVLGVAATTYGCIVGKFQSASNVFDALQHGISHATPIIIVYTFAAELYHSICWVLYF